MKTITVLTLFISLILGACGDKHAIEAQPYAVQTIRDAEYSLYSERAELMQEIKNAAEFSPELAKNDDNLSLFSAKLSLSVRKWENVRFNNPKADCENEIMDVHQHFSQLLSTDTFFTTQVINDDFRQKVENFPRAFAQIRAKIKHNPHSETYWYTYIRFIFSSLEAELYKLCLKSLPDRAVKNYELVAYMDYENLPKVGKKSTINAFILPSLATNLSKIKIEMDGKRLNFTRQGQIVGKINPQNFNAKKIPLIATIQNEATGETVKFTRYFNPKIHK